MFYKANVAFHYIRLNVYDPWKTIGVYVTGQSISKCRYDDRYRRLEKQFDLEVKDAGRYTISCSEEFLNDWRVDHQHATSVICPIIRYYIKDRNFSRLLNRLYTDYVCNSSPIKFANMAIMLKSDRGYFPIAKNVIARYAIYKKELRERGIL